MRLLCIFGGTQGDVRTSCLSCGLVVVALERLEVSGRAAVESVSREWDPGDPVRESS